MNKYIGENRLTYLWGKIKAFVSNAISGKVDKVSSSTDNAVVRFDGTGGAIQDSSVTIADTGVLTVDADVIVKGSSTNTNTGRLTSNANSVLAVKNSSGTVLCSVTNADFKRGSSAGDMNLGSSAAPWNNAYAKKWITDGGTSSQFVKGDGSLDSNSYVSSTDAIKNADYIVSNAVTMTDIIKRRIYDRNTQDSLWAANSRFVVTHKKYSSTDDSLLGNVSADVFKGHFESSANNVYDGEYAILYIGNVAEDELSSTTTAANGIFTYPNGKIFMTFYSSMRCGEILEAKGWFRNDTTWRNLTVVANNTTVYEIQVPNVNYLKAVRIKYSGSNLGSEKKTSLTDVAYIRFRDTINERNLITKYPTAQRMYGNLTAPKFITSGGTSSQFVKGDGTLDSNTYTPQTSTGANSLISTLPTWTATPTDGTYLIMRDTGGTASFGQVTFATVWAYIASKISSVLGIDGSNGTPTAPTAASGTNTTQIATTAFVQSAVPKDYQVDYSKTYLTFEALESGTFTFTGYSTNTVSYSTDDGKTWTSLASATASPTISAGDRIMWKASGLSIDANESGIGTFSATGNFNIEGNAMSLASGDDFIGKTTVSPYQFRTLFKNNTKLISAENLILPATTASVGCYREMFYGCTGLTTSPELPATTLSNNCYDYMFYDCTSLKTAPKLYVATLANNSYRGLFYGCTLINYIECLATDISASNCTQYITRDVASTGTFVIADGMTSWQRNYHGIPSAWTVRTKSEMEHVTKGELDDVVGDIETLLASI